MAKLVNEIELVFWLACPASGRCELVKSPSDIKSYVVALRVDFFCPYNLKLLPEIL